MSDTEGVKPKRSRTSETGLFVVGEPDANKTKKVPVKVSGPFTSRAKAINFQRKCENPEAAFILKVREVDGWKDHLLDKLIREADVSAPAVAVDTSPVPVAAVVTSDELGATGPSPTPRWWGRISRRGN